ncbi:hypothetical protein BOX15_Mlig015074g1 [Macrostomum lignano]|uniref:Frizzled-4 n=1 Tax=Macrostomum lignano TaxID=282301 RepID=A0A267G042_9PLAT|nr:hypothetical protein BOX15_Mlig015074g1 [Macrostomum lignano]
MQLRCRPRPQPLLLLLLLCWLVLCRAQLGDLRGDPEDLGRPPQCNPVDITVPMCKGLNYSSTSDHLALGTQNDVATLLHQFSELIKARCAPFLRLFVCSMHLPFCNEQQHLLVRPCREFCFRIRGLCEPVMQTHGYGWPDRLACEPLPSSKSKHLCLVPKHDEFNAELDNLKQRKYPFGVHHVGMEDRPNRPLPPPPPPPPQQPPPRNRSGAESPSGARQCSAAEVRLGQEPNSSCAPRCHASLLFSAEDKQLASVWMTLWASLCLACTGMAVATFLLDSDRFKFPERPIVWVAVCYAVYSAAHLLRAFLGPDLACSSHRLDGRDRHLVSQYAGQWCAAVFLLLYSSWLAGLLWWLALTICWYLCAVKKWAHEALSAKSVWMHLAAWGLPLLLSVLLLVLHRIEADELTHLCVVDGSQPFNLVAFVIGPCAGSLLLGLGFLTCGLCSSVTVRDSLKWSGNLGFRRLEKLMTKISLFSFLFVLPTLCVLSAAFYELAERPGWAASLRAVLAKPHCAEASGLRLDLGADCSPERRPSSALYMLKVFMSLAAGLPAGLVVWVNGKSLEAWRRCFCQVLLRRKSSFGGGRRRAGGSAGGVPYASVARRGGVVGLPNQRTPSCGVSGIGSGGGCASSRKGGRLTGSCSASTSQV